jgi:hypothetical protein
VIRQSWPETITAQEVFDHVIEHLREQKGERCIGDGSCRYRNGKPGAACAAGCLLTDEEAKKLTEGVAWTNQFSDDKPARLEPHNALIADLQVLHDGPVLSFKHIDIERVSEIASRYGLAYKKPENEPW